MCVFFFVGISDLQASDLLGHTSDEDVSDCSGTSVSRKRKSSSCICATCGRHAMNCAKFGHNSSHPGLFGCHQLLRRSARGKSRRGKTLVHRNGNSTERI